MSSGAAASANGSEYIRAIGGGGPPSGPAGAGRTALLVHDVSDCGAGLPGAVPLPRKARPSPPAPAGFSLSASACAAARRRRRRQMNSPTRTAAATASAPTATPAMSAVGRLGVVPVVVAGAAPVDVGFESARAVADPPVGEEDPGGSEVVGTL
jgi:hypothetical protein